MLIPIRFCRLIGLAFWANKGLIFPCSFREVSVWLGASTVFVPPWRESAED
jgi:hypothetical protein